MRRDGNPILGGRRLLAPSLVPPDGYWHRRDQLVEHTLTIGESFGHLDTLHRLPLHQIAEHLEGPDARGRSRPGLP